MPSLYRFFAVPFLLLNHLFHCLLGRKIAYRVYPRSSQEKMKNHTRIYNLLIYNEIMLLAGIKKARSTCYFWCPGRDSNSHGSSPVDFESTASTIPPPGHFKFSSLYLVRDTGFEPVTPAV